jgi:DNA-binding GntR family transcriptional regulator
VTDLSLDGTDGASLDGPRQSGRPLPPTVAAFVADALEEDILAGRIAPGAPLHQLDLAAAFGVSRVPVREALHMLLERQLAVRVPRKGVIARPITVQGVRDVFAARRILDAEATRLATARMGPAEIASLEAIIERQRMAARAHDLAVSLATDRTFHATIWGACGNDVLAGLLAALWRMARQAHSVGWRAPDWPDRSIARHERIVAGLRAGDADEAVRRTLAAIDASERDILTRLQGRRKGEP